MDIQAFNIKPELKKFLESEKIKNYTEVQQRVIPKLLLNQQLLVKAPTGSGKTYSFLIPIINNLNFELNEPQAIIFVPTRELGMQIYQEIKKISKFFENEQIKVQLLIGGKEKDHEVRTYGTHQIIIGTPSRISIIHNLKPIPLRGIKNVVIDEIDMIYDFGFVEELMQFYNKAIVKSSVSIFSATLNFEIKQLTRNLFQNNFEEIEIKNKSKLVNLYIKQDDNNKLDVLLKIIKSDLFNPFLGIIFAKSNEEVKSIYDFLKLSGIKDLAFFNNSLNQRERKRLLNSLKNEKIIYLVTTDLMARGMDFKGTSHIINVSLPSNNQYYMHRIGRTNRSFMTKGVIYSIVNEQEYQELGKIALKNDIKLEKFRI